VQLTEASGIQKGVCREPVERGELRISLRLNFSSEAEKMNCQLK